MIERRRIPTYHFGPGIAWGANLDLVAAFIAVAGGPETAVRLLAHPPSDIVSVEYA
jgi:hypothetical protein